MHKAANDFLRYTDLQHAIFLMTTGGKLFLAPIGSDVQNVLDLGTGAVTLCLDWTICFG